MKNPKYHPEGPREGLGKGLEKGRTPSRRRPEDKAGRKVGESDVPLYSVKNLGAVRVRVDRAGRLVVPAKFRKALGIEEGAELTACFREGVLRLQTIENAIARAQALAQANRGDDDHGSVVDQFIAERRAAAAKE